jgi:hypothetical protein
VHAVRLRFAYAVTRGIGVPASPRGDASGKLQHETPLQELLLADSAPKLLNAGIASGDGDVAGKKSPEPHQELIALVQRGDVLRDEARIALDAVPVISGGFVLADRRACSRGLHSAAQAAPRSFSPCMPARRRASGPLVRVFLAPLLRFLRAFDQAALAIFGDESLSAQWGSWKSNRRLERHCMRTKGSR